MEIPDTPYGAGLPPTKFIKWRAYQQDAIMKILNSDKKFLILEAPTGFGKSPAAIAISNLFHKSQCEKFSPTGTCACGQHLDLEQVKRGKSKTVYVASTKQLQSQIVVDFPTARLVKGRSNFDCELSGNRLKVDKCIYEAKGEGAKKCPGYRECKYFVQRNEAMKARLSIHNYAFFLNAQRGCLFRDFDLLILDEAHTAENALMSFVSFKFTYNMFQFTETPFPNDNREEVLETLKDIRTRLEGKIHVKEQQLTDNSDIRNILEVHRLKNLRTRINDFLDTYKDNWLFKRHKDRQPKKSYVEFRPIWVDEFGHLFWDYLKEDGKVLLMSATIGDDKMFCELLGIPYDQSEFISLPSTFPVKNRRIVFTPVGRLSLKSYEKNRDNMMKMIENLANQHKDEKGVIHTINYKIAKDIEADINLKCRDRMIFPRRETRDTNPEDRREQVLNSFKKSKDSLILVSPSFGLGVDFPGETAEWQIIVKVPFAYLGDEQVRRRLKDSEKWYRVDAANRCIQTAGRIVRSYEDYGITYLLDTNFFWFFNEDPTIFPEWFKEAVVTSKDRKPIDRGLTDV